MYGKLYLKMKNIEDYGVCNFYMINKLEVVKSGKQLRAEKQDWEKTEQANDNLFPIGLWTKFGAWNVSLHRFCS